MFRIDSREKGNIVDKLQREIPEAVVSPLYGGDYHIKKADGDIIAIERTKLMDFIGKIVSGRIDKQIAKCKELSDDVMLILEGMQSPYRSKISYKSVVGKIASLTQEGVHVVCLRNASETLHFLVKLHKIHTVDGGIVKHEMKRVKPIELSLGDESKMMLMGVKGIGEKTATDMLVGRSIKDLINSNLENGRNEKHLKEVVNYILQSGENNS